jgi:hypothetical protein
MIDEARTAAVAQPISLAGEATTAALVQQAASSLILLTRQITDLDKQITGVFRQHRHAHILESVPGIGTRSGPNSSRSPAVTSPRSAWRLNLPPTLASPRCRMILAIAMELCAGLSVTTAVSQGVLHGCAQ